MERQWISFCVNSNTYVHAVSHIKEVIPYSPPTPVPGTSSDVEGILNVRGHIVTVLSAQQLFGGQEQPFDTQQRIIIIEQDEQQLGISVDAVENIVVFDKEKIDEQSIDDSILGTIQIDQQLMIVCDFTSAC